MLQWHVQEAQFNKVHHAQLCGVARRNLGELVMLHHQLLLSSQSYYISWAIRKPPRVKVLLHNQQQLVPDKKYVNIQ